MKQFISGMLCALLVIAVYACTQPGAAGSGGGGGGVLFKVNGRGVSAEEFFATRGARDAVQQYVMMESMKEEARKVGAKVDEKEFNEELDKLKKDIQAQNQSWDEFLKRQNMSDKEFNEQRRTFALFQALMKKKANVTEEEMKKVWETDKEALISDYAAKNHLPDSEKTKVTYEQVKEQARERVEMNKMGMIQSEVMGDIILNAKLEFVGVKDAKRAKELAEQVMKPARDQAEEQKKMAEEQKKAEEAAKAGTPENGAKAGEGSQENPPAPVGDLRKEREGEGK